MTASAAVWRRVLPMAIAGGLGFWAANLAISLTPIAAEYRAALSIPYLPMLLEALVGGLVLGVCVAYPLVRYPSNGSTLVRSVVLSAIALGIVTLVLELPSKFLGGSADPLRYVLIGLLFKVIRIAALAVGIGLVAGRRTAVPA